jgi:DNA ligase (NAD+)
VLLQQSEPLGMIAIKALLPMIVEHPEIPDDIQEAWSALVREIKDHDRRYYQESAPILHDSEYDALKQALRALEASYPKLLLKAETVGVGYRPTGPFQKVHHLAPLFSLENVFDPKELDRTVQKVRKFLGLSQEQSMTWVAEPKIDGLTVVLRYVGGHLVQGATRGDGTEGEDVTKNIKTIAEIPHDLCGHHWPDVFEVRGEVFMTTKAFHDLNKTRREEGQSPFANPRNASSGSLRQLDASITQSRSLLFMAHGCSVALGRTYQEMLTHLAAWNLPVSPFAQAVETVSEIQAYWETMQIQRHNLGFEMDGVVYKVDGLDWQERLGYSSRVPRWAFAYKFPPIQAHSVLERIEIQIGRTGVLTPVAHVGPILLAGVRVSRASLHNEDEVQRKDLRIGDTVILERAGDVIPQIVRVVLEKRSLNSEVFVFPEHCPVCHHPALRMPGEAARRCTGGMLCPAQAIWRLRHWVSREAFNIEGLGKKQVAYLYQNGWVRCPLDFFKLQQSDLEVLPGWGKRSAEKIIQSIAARRTISLQRFFIALGIPQVGQSMATTLANTYHTFSAWKKAMEEAYVEGGDYVLHLAIQGVGPSIAFELVMFVHTHAKLLEDLMGILDIQPYVPVKSHFLSGKSIVFTGTLTHMTRAEAKTLAEQKGAQILSAVSSKTAYVIAGTGGGIKLKQAQNLGIPILSESDWNRLMADDHEVK